MKYIKIDDKAVWLDRPERMKTKAKVSKPIAMNTGVITGNTNAGLDYIIDKHNER